MRRVLEFAGALVGATMIHLVAARLVPNWALMVDLMLIVVVFNALEGRLIAGMAGGLIAGWASDALVGSMFGLYGLADTIIGYAAAFAVQRVVIQRAAGAALLFALAAAAQQLLVLGLGVLLLGGLEIPAYYWIVVKAGIAGVLGGILFSLKQRVSSSVDLWRRTRKTRIRLER